MNEGVGEVVASDPQDFNLDWWLRTFFLTKVPIADAINLLYHHDAKIPKALKRPDLNKILIWNVFQFDED